MLCNIILRRAETSGDNYNLGALQRTAECRGYSLGTIADG